jgi:hypothetical protein
MVVHVCVRVVMHGFKRGVSCECPMADGAIVCVCEDAAVQGRVGDNGGVCEIAVVGYGKNVDNYSVRS